MSNITAQQAQLIAGASQGLTDSIASYGEAAAARSQLRLEAKFEDAQANDARYRANLEAARLIGKGDRGRATARAQVAASGFATGVGTAADLESTPAFIAAMDAATIRENGRREAYTRKTGADLKRVAAGSISPWGNAARTAVGSAGKVAARWLADSYDPTEK